jgi:hypothetical protein
MVTTQVRKVPTRIVKLNSLLVALTNLAERYLRKIPNTNMKRRIPITIPNNRPIPRGSEAFR